MFTPELITLLGGTLLGGILKIFKAKADFQSQLLNVALAKHSAADASADAAARRGGSGGPATRRLIVCVVLFTVFLAPFILSAWLPATPIFYAYSEAKGGFWFFSSGLEKLQFVRLDGFVLLPVHTQMASAIAGFYFGAGIVK